MTARPWPSILIVGPTGSGKTPLGDEMEKRGLGGRRCVHFDFGENLRLIAASPREQEGLTAGDLEAIRGSLATGALFEDKDMPMIVRVLERFVSRRGARPGSLLVLNGLPRHRKQAESLAGVAAVERVVHLEAGALDGGGTVGVKCHTRMSART